MQLHSEGAARQRTWKEPEDSPEDSRIHLKIQDLPQRLRRFAANLCGKDRKAKIAKGFAAKVQRLQRLQSKDCKDSAAKIAKIRMYKMHGFGDVAKIHLKTT